MLNEKIKKVFFPEERFFLYNKWPVLNNDTQKNIVMEERVNYC